jgi:SRSO17 transposase
MEWNARLWKNSISELTKFMAPLVATLGRSERRRAAMHYVEGLLIPGQRKSIEPMAARLGVDSQSLQQLLTSSPWSDEALWKAIRQEVIPHLEPLEAWGGG